MFEICFWWNYCNEILLLAYLKSFIKGVPFIHCQIFHRIWKFRILYEIHSCLEITLISRRKREYHAMIRISGNHMYFCCKSSFWPSYCLRSLFFGAQDAEWCARILVLSKKAIRTWRISFTSSSLRIFPSSHDSLHLLYLV